MPSDASSWDDEFDELLAEAVAEPALLIPGAELADGRFVVRALLGTGGMGAVYRATDTRHGRDIAVKVLARVESAGIYGLKQEFRSLSTVDHPNLVNLHELYSDGSSWFVTMDLVAGEPLSKAKWTLALVRHVFGQIAEAIHAIHSQGKLHRDLKPSNVMVTPTGQVVVLDFGLVSDQEPGGAGRTVADDGFVGTPTYMAPEQAIGSAGPASDWYAFGVMLYEALFGRPPFEERGVAVLTRKREEPAPLPAAVAGDVPQELQALCMRLLERSAPSRPGYAEVIAVLGSAQAVAEPAAGAGQTPFVGREPELSALERALCAADGGRSALVVVSGEAGSGKTRLVQRFLDLVRTERGGVVIAGRCPQAEHVPFRACDSLIDSLSRFLRALPSERAASVLPRDFPALTQIFPVLGRLPAARTLQPRQAPPQDPTEARRLGLAALRELVGSLAAEQRLVIFVDDMHWSDVEGALLLASLLNPPAEPQTRALLLIIAHRTPDADESAGLTAFFDHTAAHPDLQVSTLHIEGHGTA